MVFKKFMDGIWTAAVQHRKSNAIVKVYLSTYKGKGVCTREAGGTIRI